MVPDQLKDNPHVTALGSLAEEATDAFGELTIYVNSANIFEACQRMRDRGFNRISAITTVDWYPAEPRFEIVYHLHLLPTSPQGGNHERLRLKCRVSGESPEIDSVTSIWNGANWYEREVFDLFGVRFRNHPNLIRIMMPDYWEGHPLRKDFPIHGHKYDYAQEQ